MVLSDKMTVKELKSVDIASYTTISTAISILISIIIAIILVGVIAVSVPDSFGIMVYIIPTIVFGTLICSVFTYFMEGYLYNILSKRIGTVKFDIEEDKYIKKISTKETALIAGIITLILLLVVYLAVSLILPIILNSFITILMYSSQMDLAYALYQYILVLSNPTFIIIGLIAITIISSVFTLLAIYIYNILASSERGINVELVKEDKYTVIDSINPMNFAVAIAAISLILNIIVGLIMVISGNEIFAALSNALIGFVVSFIESLLVAFAYNFLAPKLGKLKVELDEIN